MNKCIISACDMNGKMCCKECKDIKKCEFKKCLNDKNENCPMLSR